MITLRFSDLEKGKDLSDDIEKAFGPNGLGILLVNGIPNYEIARRNMLEQSILLADLSSEKLMTLEDRKSNYNIGWSHGKEKIGGGKTDTMKGSFYANPIRDVQTEDIKLIEKFPDTMSPNIWPTDYLPYFESAFKTLGKIVVETGKLVGKQCDNYIFKKAKICHIIETAVSSNSPKSRLLHYFSFKDGQFGGQFGGQFDDWCKWHKDHGSLTGLTRAMFIDEITRKEVENPDPNCGLWVRTSQGIDVKIIIPEDCLAFQIGETSQIMSGGLLNATTHCVCPINVTGIARCTFATFMQPDSETSIDPVFQPQGMEKDEGKLLGVKRYKRPMTFGEFSNLTINENY